MLCDDAKFTLPNEQPSLLTHLFNAHKMVIGEVDLIADLPAYMTYWRNKFRFSKQPTEEALQTYCTVMKVQVSEPKSIHYHASLPLTNKQDNLVRWGVKSERTQRYVTIFGGNFSTKTLKCS